MYAGQRSVLAATVEPGTHRGPDLVRCERDMLPVADNLSLHVRSRRYVPGKRITMHVFLYLRGPQPLTVIFTLTMFTVRH